MPVKPLKKIIVVGGGTSGWLAAVMLSRHLKPENCQITLIESSRLSTIGVGESTIPPLVKLMQNLGVDEQEFISATGACYKLGIKFVDWRERGHTFFHPFGTIGKRIASHDFYQCWYRAKLAGHPSELMDFSPNAVMAEQGCFFPLRETCSPHLGKFSYALHLDAKRLADFLRGIASEHQVARLEGEVTQVIQADDGRISQLILASGETIAGDFFIDCSGFSALMIGKCLGVELEDWSNYLPCDRAITVKAQSTGKLLPYTIATARKAGWGWRIPLRDLTGHGYVYASRFCSDTEAKSTLLRHLDGRRASEPRLITFTTGKRKEFWKHNCLSLGLAAGFIEPLESTSIHLTARGIEFFLRLFPDKDCEPSLIKEYNRRLSDEFEQVRDFIILHYCATQRTDTPFWQWCREMPIPASLEDKIELFRGHGIVREGLDDLFRSSSWQSVFEGLGIRPAKYCPRTDNLEEKDLQEHLSKNRSAIQAMVGTLPGHDEFLEHNAASQPPAFRK